LSPNDIDDVVQFLFQQEKRPADPDAAARGKKIFQTRGACWDCHGDQGEGDDAVGAPKLTDNIWLFGDSGADDIKDVIENGRKGECPAWVGRLSPAEILEVSLYIYSLSHSAGEARNDR
jgi:cytochrome c oxidase cbb3-type subunit 3